MNLPLKEDSPNGNKGLFAKYFIQKIKGLKYTGTNFLGQALYKPILDHVEKDAEYFVLRLDENGDPEHVKASIKAVLVYADAIENYLPELAADLRKRYKI